MIHRIIITTFSAPFFDDPQKIFVEYFLYFLNHFLYSCYFLVQNLLIICMDQALA